MSLHSATMLALVLFLGQKINTQVGSLSNPTIYAEPGLVIPQGSFVTFVCSNPDGYDTFRLEKKIQVVMDKKNTWPPMNEARFFLDPVNKSIAGHYTCIYKKGNTWSPRSKTLELKVTSEDVTLGPATDPAVTSDIPRPRTDSIYILIVVSVVFHFCLLLFLFFCLRRHNRNKQGLPNSKSQHQSTLERLSLATNSLERAPGKATDDRLPEDRRKETWTLVAGDLQEVTYAQLDHHSVPQRAVGAVTPQTTDIIAESSTYATIIRH